jgi:hypothetical protein
MRAKAGTYFVLLSDGISDNLPVDFIDRLVHRHTLARAAVGLPSHTRERRAQMQRHGGGSTSQLGLDNMSAIVVRFDGVRQPASATARRLEDARLFAVFGTHGGPRPSSGGYFGLICLAGQHNGATLVPSFLSSYLESEHQASAADRLRAAYLASMPGEAQTRFAALARDEGGESHTFSAGLPDLTTLFDVGISERSVEAARDSAVQRFIYSPRVWASSLAVLALLLLVSTAFATGTVRPAPPPVPTVAPGEPTPTPDTRPRLSLGGFLLVGPPAAATPTPAPAPAPAPPAVQPVDEEPSAQDEPPTDTPTCNNPLGLLCGNPAPPPPPPQRSQPRQPQQPAPAPSSLDTPPVLPVASPGAVGGDPSEVAAPAGSNLDRALRIASVANEHFNHSLEAPSESPSSGN